MQNNWESTPKDIWTGRDDSSESPSAKRVFQTITHCRTFEPLAHKNKIALMGFMCDEGIKINKGCIGAKNAPNIIRKELGNFADHSVFNQLVDLGNIVHLNEDLPTIQSIFTQHVIQCHNNNLVTLVLGGGHETAFSHGMGLYKSYPDKEIGIINFDAHLDMRTSKVASSGTPFKQLADYCQNECRSFNYLCIGANLSANTDALIETAYKYNVDIICDKECTIANQDNIIHSIKKFIDKVDVIYLTIDLDVLPSPYMFAVSAPNSLGVDASFFMKLIDFIIQSKKLKAADIVEYNPELDVRNICAKLAARFAWEICCAWKKQHQQ